MAKNIALFFDGTWNKPADTGGWDVRPDTNVCKLSKAIPATDATGRRQHRWYDAGVGSEWHDRLLGAFGWGLSQNIREGYEELVRQYEEGDRIFLFGFSRGAYTARSLAGMIRSCGLLLPEHIARVGEAYAVYRIPDKEKKADKKEAVLFRTRYSRLIDIHFIGVWDTVGRLGVPFKIFNRINRERYQFHDTTLSARVKNAYQALAIDEHRRDYEATLWEPSEKPGQVIEQVWFAGAHADVGGGYADHDLSDIALSWMMDRAERCGLGIAGTARPPGGTHSGRIHDSYAGFLGGTYRVFSRRHYRPIGMTAFATESIDPSVELRCREVPDYNPPNRISGALAGPCLTSKRQQADA